MKLSWKDGVTTLITAGVAFIAWVSLRGWDVALIRNHRLAILVMGALGLATCIFIGSGSTPDSKSTYTKAMGLLGIVAFIAIAAGLISGLHLFVWSVAAITLILWAGSTIHHALQ